MNRHSSINPQEPPPRESGFNLSALAVRERSITLFFILATAVAGIYSFLEMGRAEDPAFTVRVLLVSAFWPGADTRQMQDLVADPLEKRISQVEYFYRVQTTARPGRVDMRVEFQEYSPADQVSHLFYEVRKRMTDAAAELPKGVIGPFVNDEFSDVYFALYALTAPGLPMRHLLREAERVRDELARVDGVQKVRVLGERPERVFVRLDQARLANLGIGVRTVAEALAAHNELLPNGSIETDGPRVYLRLPQGLDDLEAVRAVPLRVGTGAQARLIRLGDIAEVGRGYEDPANYLIRANGQDALLLGVVMRAGENGLDLGARLAEFVEHERQELPLGMDFAQLTNQSEAISQAVDLFQLKFLVAVIVVMVISFIALGWRAGVVVGIAIPLTLGLTFLLMLIYGIDLDRVSLGALIIALGLLVDDAIISIEMMLVKMEAGWDRLRSAAHAWHVTAAPMLSGTAVTAIGFVPIGFARSGVGEYAGNIFWVLAFALGVSWLVAVTFTPYLGTLLLKPPRHVGGAPDEHTAYHTPLYQRMRALVRRCVMHKWLVVVLTFGLLVLASFGLAGPVQKQFFPTSDRPEILIDITLPEGSGIAATTAVAKRVEAQLLDEPKLASLSTYIGAGPPRFFLALSPELSNPAYAQLIGVATDATARDRVIERLQEQIDAGHFPEARVRVHKLLYGPPVAWPVSFRVLGPEPQVLREIAERVRAVVAANPHTVDAHLKWGERAPVVRLETDPERLRLIGLTPNDLSRQLQYELSGVRATELREDVRAVPLELRGLAGESSRLGALGDISIKTRDGRSIPLAQAGTLSSDFEEPVLMRYNREPVIAVNAEVSGAQAPDVTAEIWQALEQVRAELPFRYRIDVGGSVEESGKADASIVKIAPVMLVLMLTVIMLQMRSFSGMAMVVATAPLGVIGATLALLAGGQAFGFVALLGMIGLAGILMRNTLILAKQIDDNLAAGMPRDEAVVEATVRRTRPVLLTALAAVFAFMPLATDTFWGPLAYVLIGGVIVGTAITLLFLPALYSVWFGVKLSSGGSRANAPS